MKVVTVDQMRQIERECAGIGLPGDLLMENAGRAVAQETARILGTAHQKNIIVLVGPGNNGGDGLVAARYLHDSGARTTVYLCAERGSDPNLEKVCQRSIPVVNGWQDEKSGQLEKLLLSAECAIDAVFGTGKARSLEGTYRRTLETAARIRLKSEALRIVALDLPSGLDADTGEVDPACPFADYTITLGYPKLGLFMFPGAERAGKLSISDIGMPDYMAEAVSVELMTANWARTVLPARPLDSNKGTFGRVMVVAGSVDYPGAAYLACSGAIRAGAGLVTLATAASLQPVLAAKMNEVTYFSLPELQPGLIAHQAAELLAHELGKYNVLLMGCGLGLSPSVMKFVSMILMKRELPALVLDADALNILARVPGWSQELIRDAILTPHPGEMSRLAQVSVEMVQADRMGIARKLAEDWNKTIILKGAFSVIAAPDGRCRISAAANPGLASAGTGDVLSGVVAGLVAQGLSLFDAASLGVYLHGEAGEIVRGILGDTGMVASDLFASLPVVIKKLKEARLNKEEIHVTGN